MHYINIQLSYFQCLNIIIILFNKAQAPPSDVSVGLFVPCLGCLPLCSMNLHFTTAFTTMLHEPALYHCPFVYKWSLPSDCLSSLLFIKVPYAGTSSQTLLPQLLSGEIDYSHNRFTIFRFISATNWLHYPNLKTGKVFYHRLFHLKGYHSHRPVIPAFSHLIVSATISDSYNYLSFYATLIAPRATKAHQHMQSHFYEQFFIYVKIILDLRIS